MKEQKTELHEWQSKGGAERGRGDAKTKKAKFDKDVAAAAEKKISEQTKASEEEKMARDKLRSLITSIIKETRETSTSHKHHQGNPGDVNFRQMSHYHWSSNRCEQIR